MNPLISITGFVLGFAVASSERARQRTRRPVRRRRPLASPSQRFKFKFQREAGKRRALRAAADDLAKQLERLIGGIEAGRTVSIGSIGNTKQAQISVTALDAAREALAAYRTT